MTPADHLIPVIHLHPRHPHCVPLFQPADQCNRKGSFRNDFERLLGLRFSHFHDRRDSLFFKKILKKRIHEGCPGRTSLRMHRLQIPASWSFTGPSVGFPLNCPGIGSYTVDLDRHLEPVSFSATEPMPFDICSLPGPRDIPVFPVQPGDCNLFIVPGLLAG
jgi:hypothetical protein